MGTLSTLMGSSYAGGVVKSVQRGATYTYNATITISAIDTTKSIIIVNNYGTPYYTASGRITNSTTINLNCSTNTYINWQVIEFF